MNIDKIYHLFCKYCLKDWEVSQNMPIEDTYFWWGKVDWSNWRDEIYICACYDCRVKYEKVKRLRKCKPVDKSKI